ncbi:hypothetical protein BRC61_08010 [Halobacteriales archaeon QH_10_65_19]|nr:MAG: hypothetical protein BRC61_08010 [Halobacteriales archaeon QH_10_65_19]
MENSEESTGELTPPAEAFAAVANEIRVGILRALFDAEEPRSFSDLRGDVEGPVGAVVLDHPAVVAFHDEHGIDLRKTLVWELPWLFEDHATEESEDPHRMRVTPEVDGDRISLVLDGDMSVVSVDTDP